MNSSTFLTRVGGCALLISLASCAHQKHFTDFLVNEIGSLGGKTNTLAGASQLRAEWSATRDKFGTAIDAKGVRFEDITNMLTTAYGEPRLYTPGNQRHAAVFLYPPASTGISIFVSGTTTGSEITLTKPINTP